MWLLDMIDSGVQKIAVIVAQELCHEQLGDKEQSTKPDSLECPCLMVSLLVRIPRLQQHLPHRCRHR